jgi:hypothetical protein
MEAPPQCRHCHAAAVSRPRGLCWRCFYTPGIKEKYPSTHRGIGLKQPTGPASFPTNALPGSDAKIEIMKLRAGLRQELYHPQDARELEDRPEPLPDSARVYGHRELRVYRVAVPA